MPGGALREYPGRDSNPQCPRGRTAFKAADFASLSTRAGAHRIVRPGGSRNAASVTTTRQGPRPLSASPASMTPAPDRRRVSRSLGWFYLGAPLLAEAWLALAAGRPAHTAAMVAICLLAQAAGALLARGLADD